MKRIVAFMLFCILIFSLCSCSKEKEDGIPITVNGTPISGEVFRYFLDEARKTDGITGKDAIITAASEKCIRYVAINSTFVQAGLELTPAEKADANSRGNVLWQMFGEYYKSIGVSKQTYLKINLSGEYTEKLRLAFFDKGGTDEISDAVLRGYLKEYYVSFKLISAPLSKSDVYGKTTPLTPDERTAVEKFYSIDAGYINAGYKFDDMSKRLADEVPASQQAPETLVINKEHSEFSEAFYENIRTIEEGKAGLYEDKDFIYLIYRTDILGDAKIFESYRDDCLLQASEVPLESKINTMCNSYTSKRNTRLADEYYQQVMKIK